MFLVHPDLPGTAPVRLFILSKHWPAAPLTPRWEDDVNGPKDPKCLALQAEATQRAEEGGAFWFSLSLGKANHTDLFLSANFR